MKSRASAVLPAMIGTTRQIWSVASGPFPLPLIKSPMRARPKGRRVPRMAVRVSCRYGRTAESAGCGIEQGRGDPAPARSVILSGKRWRLLGGWVKAEPVAGPHVIARDVDVLAAGLLRAGWLPLLVDVGPEQVVGAEERAGREVEHQELIRRCPVGEAGRPRQRRQAFAGWRAEQQRRENQR